MIKRSILLTKITNAWSIAIGSHFQGMKLSLFEDWSIAGSSITIALMMSWHAKFTIYGKHLQGLWVIINNGKMVSTLYLSLHSREGDPALLAFKLQLWKECTVVWRIVHCDPSQLSTMSKQIYLVGGDSNLLLWLYGHGLKLAKKHETYVRPYVVQGSIKNQWDQPVRWVSDESLRNLMLRHIESNAPWLPCMLADADHSINPS